MVEFLRQRRHQQVGEFAHPGVAHLLEVRRPETLAEPCESVEPDSQRNPGPPQPGVETLGDGVDLGCRGAASAIESRRRDRRGLGHLPQGPCQVVAMRRKTSTSIGSHARTREVETRGRSPCIGGEIEWKEPAGHRLLVESELRVDPAESVLLQEHAGTVGTLPQVPLPAELDDDPLAESLLPTLPAQSIEILVAQLHTEVPAAVAAAVTGVPLFAEIEDRKRHGLRHGQTTPVSEFVPEAPVSTPDAPSRAAIARVASPRWLRAFFSAGDSSALVRSSPGSIRCGS